MPGVVVVDTMMESAVMVTRAYVLEWIDQNVHAMLGVVDEVNQMACAVMGTHAYVIEDEEDDRLKCLQTFSSRKMMLIS